LGNEISFEENQQALDGLCQIEAICFKSVDDAAADVLAGRHALALCCAINKWRYAGWAAYFEGAAKALFVGLHGWSPLGFGHKKTPGEFSLRARCTTLRGTLKSPPNQGGHKFGY
jgi:hypothetical protein